jgi:hypothetical protein
MANLIKQIINQFWIGFVAILFWTSIAPTCAIDQVWETSAFTMLLENVFFGEKGVCVRTPLQRGLDSSEYDLLKSEEFVQVDRVNDFPPAVKDGLHWLINDDTTMANSNEAIQETDVGEPGNKLPIRQLIKAGASEHFFLLSYRRGGCAPSNYLLLFERDGKKVFLTRGLHQAKVCSFADAVKLITDTTHFQIDTYW